MYWIGLKTLVLRECGVVLRFWISTVAPPVIATNLYFTIFGEVLGPHIGPVDGIEYIRYLAPGLIVMWIIPYSFGHTAAGLLGARLFRYIEELLVAPLPHWAIVLGFMMGGVIRGFAVATAALLTSLPFVGLEVHSVLISLLTLFLAATGSAAAGIITAALARDFERVTSIQVSILTPLAYLGGAFTPLAALPTWAQQLSFANPLFYVVSAFRYGLLGSADVTIEAALPIVFILASGLVLAAIRVARRTGIRDPAGD